MLSECTVVFVINISATVFPPSAPTPRSDQSNSVSSGSLSLSLIKSWRVSSASLPPMWSKLVVMLSLKLVLLVLLINVFFLVVMIVAIWSSTSCLLKNFNWEVGSFWARTWRHIMYLPLSTSVFSSSELISSSWSLKNPSFCKISIFCTSSLSTYSIDSTTCQLVSS